VVRLVRRLCGHDGLARGHAQSLVRRAHGPTSRPALATEPADRHSTRLHESSAPRGQESAFGASVNTRALPCLLRTVIAVDASITKLYVSERLVIM
jgi:hypothetical protein